MLASSLIRRVFAIANQQSGPCLGIRYLGASQQGFLLMLKIAYMTSSACQPSIVLQNVFQPVVTPIIFRCWPRLVHGPNYNIVNLHDGTHRGGSNEQVFYGRANVVLSATFSKYYMMSELKSGATYHPAGGDRNGVLNTTLSPPGFHILSYY